MGDVVESCIPVSDWLFNHSRSDVHDLFADLMIKARVFLFFTQNRTKDLQHVSQHDLIRHTFSRRSAREGIPLHAAAALLAEGWFVNGIIAMFQKVSENSEKDKEDENKGRVRSAMRDSIVAANRLSITSSACSPTHVRAGRGRPCLSLQSWALYCGQLRISHGMF